MANPYQRIARALLGLLATVLFIPLLTKCSEDAGAFGTEGDRLPFLTPSATIIVSGVVCLIGGAYFGRMLIGAVREGRADKWLRATLPHDVSEVLSLKMLGSTPKILAGDIEEPLLTRHDMVLTYLYLRAQFLRWRSTRTSKVVLITSTTPSEGKSTTAVGLARALARVGQRVLLVDGDMLKPNLHRLLGVKQSEDGLAWWIFAHLKGASPETQFENVQPFLDFFDAGKSPPGLPADLAYHANRNNLWALLSKNYDVVIVDGPPLVTPLAIELASGINDVILAVATSTPLARTKAMLDELVRDRDLDVRVLLTMRKSGVRAQEFWFFDYVYEYPGEPTANPRVTPDTDRDVKTTAAAGLASVAPL